MPENEEPQTIGDLMVLGKMCERCELSMSFRSKNGTHLVPADATTRRMSMHGPSACIWSSAALIASSSPICFDGLLAVRNSKTVGRCDETPLLPADVVEADGSCSGHLASIVGGRMPVAAACVEYIGGGGGIRDDGDGSSS